MPALSYIVEELEDSPKEVWERQSGASHVRRFKVPWANRLEFKEYITSVGYPGETGLLVASVKSDPFSKRPDARDTGTNMDPATFLNSFESAILEVTYKAPGRGDSREEEQSDGTRISISRESTGEFLTIPGRGMVWETTGERLPPDAHPVMVVSITRWRFRWSGVVRPPWGVIEAVKGTINKDAFTLPFTGMVPCPAETLLFEGATSEVDAQFGSSTAPQMTLVYSFLQKNIENLRATDDPDEPSIVGWNHAFNPVPGIWDKPLACDASGEAIEGAYLYSSGDLSHLFIQAGP